MRLEAQRLREKAHSRMEVEDVVIEEDQDTVHLGLRMVYIHIER